MGTHCVPWSPVALTFRVRTAPPSLCKFLPVIAFPGYSAAFSYRPSPPGGKPREANRQLCSFRWRKTLIPSLIAKPASNVPRRQALHFRQPLSLRALAHLNPNLLWILVPNKPAWNAAADHSRINAGILKASQCPPVKPCFNTVTSKASFDNDTPPIQLGFTARSKSRHIPPHLFGTRSIRRRGLDRARLSTGYVRYKSILNDDEIDSLILYIRPLKYTGERDLKKCRPLYSGLQSATLTAQFQLRVSLATRFSGQGLPRRIRESRLDSHRVWKPCEWHQRLQQL
jgi:hypothetical protein